MAMGGCGVNWRFWLLRDAFGKLVTVDGGEHGPGTLQLANIQLLVVEDGEYSTAFGFNVDCDWWRAALSRFRRTFLSLFFVALGSLAMPSLLILLMRVRLQSALKFLGANRLDLL